MACMGLLSVDELLAPLKGFSIRELRTNYTDDEIASGRALDLRPHPQQVVIVTGERDGLVGLALSCARSFWMVWSSLNSTSR